MTPHEIAQFRSETGIDLDDLESVPFVKFDTTTGEILSSGRMARGHVHLRAYLESDHLIEEASFLRHRVDLATHRILDKVE